MSIFIVIETNMQLYFQKKKDSYKYNETTRVSYLLFIFVSAFVFVLLITCGHVHFQEKIQSKYELLSGRHVFTYQS